MWPFCGAEHYVLDLPNARFRAGYNADNRVESETGPDMNRTVWERKRSVWKRPMTIVCPSRWLTKCARESILFRDWRICCIPQPLDVAQWKPMAQNHARKLLDFPDDSRIILFGAVGGEGDRKKGADLLRNALRHLTSQGKSGFRLIIFGQSAPDTPVIDEYPQTYLGRIQDDLKLIAAYSAADVMVVPSRQEAFGQTASEAHACGTPVVAFNTSGLPDIVEHKTTGYLARPFDIVDLAAGIAWVLECPERRESLGVAARNRVLQKFSEENVADSYSSLYKQILAGTSS
jgi:glycosyltransferase involved in cell wall biosynthesis